MFVSFCTDSDEIISVVIVMKSSPRTLRCMNGGLFVDGVFALGLQSFVSFIVFYIIIDLA